MERRPRRSGRPTLTGTGRGAAIVTVRVGAMDFLDTLGLWFTSATAAIERFITFLFGFRQSPPNPQIRFRAGRTVRHSADSSRLGPRPHQFPRGRMAKAFGRGTEADGQQTSGASGGRRDARRHSARGICRGPRVGPALPQDATLRRADDRRLLPAQGDDRRNGHGRRQDARRDAAGLSQRGGRCRSTS